MEIGFDTDALSTVGSTELDFLTRSSASEAVAEVVVKTQRIALGMLTFAAAKVNVNFGGGIQADWGGKEGLQFNATLNGKVFDNNGNNVQGQWQQNFNGIGKANIEGNKNFTTAPKKKK